MLRFRGHMLTVDSEAICLDSEAICLDSEAICLGSEVICSDSETISLASSIQPKKLDLIVFHNVIPCYWLHGFLTKSCLL